MPRKSNAREKIVKSTKRLVERQGARATTIDAIIQDSKAPRGSVYYYFKNGRTDMIKAALGVATAEMEKLIQQSFAGQADAPTAIKNFYANWGAYLQANQLENGCMATAVAVEGTSVEEELQQADHDTFEGWLALIAKSLVAYGFDEKRAASLATTILAAGEGAVVLVRVTKSLRPMQTVAAEVSRLAVDA